MCRTNLDSLEVVVLNCLFGFGDYFADMGRAREKCKGANYNRPKNCQVFGIM